MAAPVPGPYTIEMSPNPSEGHFIMDADGRILAVTTCEALDIFTPQEFCTAQLFRAAPELADYLRQLVDALTGEALPLKAADARHAARGLLERLDADYALAGDEEE